METITELTGITASQIKNTALLAFIGCIMLGVGEHYVTIAIGVAYPAVASFLALESHGTDDDKRWLTYWTVFGAFTLVDHFAGIVTVFIPFYLFFKVLFLVFLMHPSTEGALMLYNAYILPTVQKYESTIEEAEAKAAELAG